MSIYAISWAQQVHAPLSSNEAFVLVTLAEYANDDGTHCWPSMSTVARKCRMSRATVYRILERLEHVHHVIRKEKSGKAGGSTNSYRLLVQQAPRYPVEMAEGAPHDPEIEPVPSLFDEEGVSRQTRQGVYHGDTPLYPQGVAPDATGGVSPRDTPGVSPRDRGVAPDATGGVAPGATQPTITHQYPSAPACDGGHVDSYGDPTDCGIDVEGCTRFTIDMSIEELGRRELEAIRRRLAERRLERDERPLALEARAS